MDLSGIGPLAPILPVPVDAAGERPEPRTWRYPIVDIARGEVELTLPPQTWVRWPGDYGGEGWQRMGLSGFDVRVSPAPDGGGAVSLQFRPSQPEPSATAAEDAPAPGGV